MSSADSRKIFVGGLTLNTTQQMLSNYFAVFGDIEDAIVMTDKITGRPRGFGFVTFKEQESVERVLLESHQVDGRTVECKRAVPLDQQHQLHPAAPVPVRPSPPAAPAFAGGITGRAVQEGDDSGYNPKKIFVGGLPASCDEAKLRTYFGKYGGIMDCVVMIDRVAQRHRGFGYVTFEDPKGVDQCMAEHDAHQIDGKWIDVKRCVIQDPAQRKQAGYPTQATGPIRRNQNFPMTAQSVAGGASNDYYYNAPPSAYYASYGAQPAAYARPGATAQPAMYAQVGTARPAVADPYYAARMGAASAAAPASATYGMAPMRPAGGSAPGPASATGGYMQTGYNYYAQPAAGNYYGAAAATGYSTAGTAGYATAAPTGGYAAYGQARPSEYYGAMGASSTMGYGMYGAAPSGTAPTDTRKPTTSPGGNSGSAGYRSGPY